jgi:putative membrane protein
MIISKTAAKAVAGAILCSISLSSTSLAQEKPQLSDPEIASVAVVANQNDIGYAAIAKERSKDAKVLEFAETMARDHQSVIDQAVALVKKLGVTPKDNAVSKKLLADAEKTKKSLRAQSAATFDKAYIDNEVAYHKAVIGAVEGLLIPEAKNAELKALLEKVLPILKTHLSHAEMVQANYKK